MMLSSCPAWEAREPLVRAPPGPLGPVYSGHAGPRRRPGAAFAFAARRAAFRTGCPRDGGKRTVAHPAPRPGDLCREAAGFHVDAGRFIHGGTKLAGRGHAAVRSEAHTSEIQSLMRNSCTV